MVLQRVPTTDGQTCGVLIWRGSAFAVTIEPPWKNNQANVSCAPARDGYRCVRVMSPRYGDTFELLGVGNGRSKLLFHWGNFVKDTEGCILVGERFVDVNGDGVTDIGESKSVANNGFNEFTKLTAGLKEFTLDIRDPR
jgi:hypothetical protein